MFRNRRVRSAAFCLGGNCALHGQPHGMLVLSNDPAGKPPLMAKSKVILPRHPPRRALTKKQALRHLIHAAVRMISLGEDPFATHILIQSADKLLIDLAKRSDKSLSFRWDDPKIIKPEFRDALIKLHRETFNFFKHADLDHDKTLHVGDIANSTVLQLGACVVNYHGLFAEMTDHMRLAWSLAKLVFPKGFVMEVERLK